MTRTVLRQQYTHIITLHLKSLFKLAKRRHSNKSNYILTLNVSTNTTFYKCDLHQNLTNLSGTVFNCVTIIANQKVMSLNIVVITITPIYTSSLSKIRRLPYVVSFVYNHTIYFDITHHNLRGLETNTCTIPPFGTQRGHTNQTTVEMKLKVYC